MTETEKYIKKLEAAEKARWDNAGPLEKRVIICEDALRALNAGQFRATNHAYLAFGDKGATWEELGIAKDVQIQDLVKSKTCEVCAIGAVFCAAVSRVNDLTVDGFGRNLPNSDVPMLSYLRPWFDDATLRLMEAAFEGEVIDEPCFEDDEDEDDWRTLSEAAIEFHEEYNDEDRYLNRNPETTMRAILFNVITYKGRFNPTWKPSADEILATTRS